MKQRDPKETVVFRCGPDAVKLRHYSTSKNTYLLVGNAASFAMVKLTKRRSKKLIETLSANEGASHAD